MTTENKLIRELKSIAAITNGKQGEYYAQMVKDAKPVNISRLSEVFTIDQINGIKAVVNPKVKKCYRNAILLTQYFPDVKYVEGRVTCLGAFGIEHAFNKVGDKYVDITIELALKKNPKDEEYLSIGEYDKDTVISSFLKNNGIVGNVYQSMLFEN